MKLRLFSLKDKAIFERYLRCEPHFLSGYCFANIFIWRSLFDLSWALINKKLCLFYKNSVGCFMPLPPLGGLDDETIDMCFAVMEDLNHNSDISRIENIEEKDAGFFKRAPFSIYEKAEESIVLSKEMAGLRGEKFKHKRNLYNFFIKNYDHRFRDYDARERRNALALYEDWEEDRKARNKDLIYQAMLEDNFLAFGTLLKNFRYLDTIACVVEIENKIRAFTCGFPLSGNLFCINYEIADLKVKGLPQFVFAEFAKRLMSYREINIMEDCGFQNLKKTKLSYHPSQVVISYTALRKT